MLSTNNKTLYGIKEDAERYILISWSLIVFIASLIGDSIILIGTIKYKAIRQHKVIVAIIQHMATCDLLLTVFRVFPDTVVFFTDRWVFGELLCHLNANIDWVLTGVTLFLTCCMTALKLIIVKRPLRAQTWTTKLGHIICAAMWFLVLCWDTPIIVCKILYGKLYFSYCR